MIAIIGKRLATLLAVAFILIVVLGLATPVVAQTYRYQTAGPHGLRRKPSASFFLSILASLTPTNIGAAFPIVVVQVITP